MSEIAKVESVQSLTTTPNQLLSMAVQSGADIDKLEKLMDLQERWEKNEAMKAFSAAMTAFQANIPDIKKTRQGHNSNYADINDIARAIKPALEDAGLSYRFTQEQNDDRIKVSCVVTHLQGHQETAELTALADVSGGKNAIQAIVSAVSYLRRYTLTAVLGITTGLDDDDGGSPSITVDELLNYNAMVRQEFQSIAAIKDFLANEDYSSAKEALLEVDPDVMRALWRAPSKGGAFTTEERAKMKSNEWSKA